MVVYASARLVFYCCYVCVVCVVVVVDLCFPTVFRFVMYFVVFCAMIYIVWHGCACLFVVLVCFALSLCCFLIVYICMLYLIVCLLCACLFV